MPLSPVNVFLGNECDSVCYSDFSYTLPWLYKWFSGISDQCFTIKVHVWTFVCFAGRRLGSWKHWLLMVLFTCPLTSTSTCNTSEWLINIIRYTVMYVGLDVCIWSGNSNEVINQISHRNFPLHYSSCNDAISWFALSSEMSLNELFLSAFYHCH